MAWPARPDRADARDLRDERLAWCLLASAAADRSRWGWRGAGMSASAPIASLAEAAPCEMHGVAGGGIGKARRMLPQVARQPADGEGSPWRSEAGAAACPAPSLSPTARSHRHAGARIFRRRRVRQPTPAARDVYGPLAPASRELRASRSGWRRARSGRAPGVSRRQPGPRVVACCSRGAGECRDDGRAVVVEGPVARARGVAAALGMVVRRLDPLRGPSDSDDHGPSGHVGADPLALEGALAGAGKSTT
jgi:hypothetical protein